MSLGLTPKVKVGGVEVHLVTGAQPVSTVPLTPRTLGAQMFTPRSDMKPGSESSPGADGGSVPEDEHLAAAWEPMRLELNPLDLLTCGEGGNEALV